MGLAIILLCITILSAIVLKFLNMNLRTTIIVIICISTISTIGLCIKKPDMHKQVSIDIVDFLFKRNDDGSITTTKQTTRTIIQKKTPIKDEK